MTLSLLARTFTRTAVQHGLRTNKIALSGVAPFSTYFTPGT